MMRVTYRQIGGNRVQPCIHHDESGFRFGLVDRNMLRENRSTTTVVLGANHLNHYQVSASDLQSW